MSKNKFFFEEEPAVVDSGITLEEHADTFFGVLKEAGILGSEKEKIDLTPSPIEVERLEVKTLKSSVLTIEYGIVKDDYVLHITPTHPSRNLSSKTKLAEATRACMLELNKVVPYDLRVRIHHPQDNWEIKTMSFVIEKGADAWNFDTAKFEGSCVPEIQRLVTAACMKAV